LCKFFLKLKAFRHTFLIILLFIVELLSSSSLST
jgi:hypothetical protein